jgi:phosphate transport system substrate-binding protein
MIQNPFRAVALAAALFVMPAQAQDVTLTSVDRALRVSGDLIAWDGQFLRVETEFGAVTLDARGLDCTGPGCPILSGAVIESVLAGPPVAVWDLLPVLLSGFAAEQGLSLSSRTEGDARLHDLAVPDAPGLVMRLRVLATDDRAAVAALRAGGVDLALTLAPPPAGLPAQALAHVPLVPLRASDDPLVLADLLARVAGGRIVTDDSLLPGLALPAPFEAAAALAGPGGSSLIAALLNDHDSVGLQSLPRARGLVAEMVDACGLPLAPAPHLVRLGAWPLAQTVHAVHRSERLPLRLRQFLAYAQTPVAAQAMARTGYVDPGAQPLPPEAMRDRLIGLMLRATDLPADLLVRTATLATGAEVLSLAMRFEPGTARPDAASAAVVARLAEMAAQGRFEGRVIDFVGFTDGDGALDVNLRLSQARANAVRTAFLAALPADWPPPQTAAHGLGPAIPLACEGAGPTDALGDWARAINRRVEVWLR